MKNQFTSRMYHYVEGELKLVVKKFNKLEEAVEAGIKAGCHAYKIYDLEGGVCHEGHGRDHDHDHSYA